MLYSSLACRFFFRGGGGGGGGGGIRPPLEHLCPPLETGAQKKILCLNCTRCNLGTPIIKNFRGGSQGTCFNTCNLPFSMLRLPSLSP